MNLNAYIIRDYMEDTILWDRILEDVISLPYENVGIYEKGMRPKASIIYLISPSDFRNAYENEMLSCGGYIITGIYGQKTTELSVSVICVESIHSHMELQQQIQQIFYSFYQWEISLYQLLGRNAPLREYGICSLNIFSNPIALYTSGHRNIFYCENKKPKHQRIFHEEDYNAYLSGAEIEILRLDPAFQASVQTTRPDIYPADMWGYRILYDNVRVEDVYVARLMICESDRQIRDSDYTFLRVLSGFLSQGIKHQEILFNSHPAGFDDCILQLLQGQVPPESLMDTALASYHWKPDDSYFCVLLPVNLYDQIIHSVSSVCFRLESSVTGSAAIVFKNHIVLIVNQNHALSTRDEILSQMTYIQRENLLKSGVSNMFSNLLNISEYYQQALMALSIGSESDDMLWIFRYENYAYRHLLLRASEGSSIEALCPVGLQKLIQYDQVHKRTYTRSLKAFIENQMSVSKAIRQLFIQRATFLYQLKRVKEISGLNLNDKRCQFQLLIIFQIMEEKKYELPNG